MMTRNMKSQFWGEAYDIDSQLYSRMFFLFFKINLRKLFFPLIN